tara:strand:+ start:473 stop:802 length:330 start_codon:yes stop_codon:yes gene_type:complete
MKNVKSDVDLKWEYLVIQINIDNKKLDNTKITNPEVASEKLKGSLSPDFLKQQFPDQYQKKKANSNAPNIVSQLQSILNKIGEDGWELVESTTLANLLIFIFKKPNNTA